MENKYLPIQLVEAFQKLHVVDMPCRNLLELQSKFDRYKINQNGMNCFKLKPFHFMFTIFVVFDQSLYNFNNSILNCI